MKWKTVETRKHDRFKNLRGQRIAIHAAKKVDSSTVFNPYLPQMTPVQVENIWRFVGMCRGCIVCTAMVVGVGWMGNVDHIERPDLNKVAMCEVAGKFLLFLDDIQVLRDRVFFTGRQGIFNVPDEMIGETVPNEQQRPKD